VDVRVIAATNVDLNEQVETGAFRLDLYYRLAVLNLELPTLRQRKEDIPLLADFFLQNFSRKMKKAPMQWDEGVRDGLMQYDWPGNIRQLKNTIEAGVVLSQGKVLSLEDLGCAGLPKKPLAKVSQIDSLQDNGGASLPEFIERQEREMILEALEQNNWVQRGAAKQLGISPRVLNYKIKKLKIDPSSLNT
jgi:DNA-binding NtrC family response regulator